MLNDLCYDANFCAKTSALWPHLYYLFLQLRSPVQPLERTGEEVCIVDIKRLFQNISIFHSVKNSAQLSRKIKIS